MAKKQNTVPLYNPSQLMTSGGNGIIDNFNEFRTSSQGKDYFQMMEANRIAKKKSGRIDYSDIDPITDIALGGSLAKSIISKTGKSIEKKVIPKTIDLIKNDLSEGRNIKHEYFNQAGNKVATFSGSKTEEGIYANGIEVNSEFRRKGIASNIYKNIAKDLQAKNEGTLLSRSVQHQFTDKDELGRSISPSGKLWENLYNKKEASRFVEGMSHVYKINPLKDGGEIMKKYKVQSKSTGGQILGAAGSVASLIPGAGPIVGAGLSMVGGVVDMFAAKKEEERQRKEEQLLADKNAMAAMGTGLAEGGVVKGKGTGKSDSIKAKMAPGDFVVPVENAKKALEIRKEHFGDASDPSDLNTGSTPVNVSNGEVHFTKDEMDYLDEIGEGSAVRKLAPNATNGKNLVDGGYPRGKVGKDGKTITDPKQLAIEQAYRDSLKVSKLDPITGKPIYAVDPFSKEPIGSPTLAKSYGYTPSSKPSSKFGKFTTENAGAILGVGQAIAGLIQGAKNARQERNLKPIQSNAAIANSEAIDTKMTADKAANAIMAGNTAEADRATGNYMRMAKEAGGANSATVLANAARVGQSSSDSYLKGMTTAAQLKMAGQQAGSEMKIKAGEQSTQVAMYNDQAERRLLEAKSANANNLLASGLTNTGMALARAEYNKKMAYLDKNVKHNLTGEDVPRFKKGGMVGDPDWMNFMSRKEKRKMPEDRKKVIRSSEMGYNLAMENDMMSSDERRNAHDAYNKNELLKRKESTVIGYKNGGLVKKYKKSKILNNGR